MPLALQVDREEERARRLAWARSLSNRIRPAAGTVVERYLGSRGLELPPSSDLGVVSCLQHRDQRASVITHWPAMVCCIRDVDRYIIGVHRTWLRPDGCGKAPVDTPKMTLGPCRGGAIRLCEAGDTIAISEGIENALSYTLLTGTPAWAAGSTSGLKALVLAPQIRDVIIAADADRSGEAAAQAAALRWTREGRRVRIVRPPVGLDFNDVLVRRRAP